MAKFYRQQTSVALPIVEPKHPEAPPAELCGRCVLFGIRKAPEAGKWFAVSYDGNTKVESVLTPKRNSKYVGESKHAALARIKPMQAEEWLR